MADYYNPDEIRASSSAFMWGSLTYTKYKTGCLRRIMLQSRNIQVSIDGDFGRRGAHNEDRHDERLSSGFPMGTSAAIRWTREHEFKTPVVIGDKVIHLSGHVDFVFWDDLDAPVAIDELKSVKSKNVLREVIKNGQWTVENLAQTVAYMVAVKVQHGRLIYTYYEETASGALVQKDERIFVVMIDDFGRIHVDGEPTRFTVLDQLAHRIYAARVVATGEVGPRPHLWDSLPFASPCTYCPFKQACDKWDAGAIESSDAFVELSKGLARATT